VKVILLKKLLLGFLLLSLISSCKEEILYENNLSIKNGKWDRAESAVFTFEVEDTINRYSLYLNVRHAGDYPYKNLYLFTKTISPNGKFALDTAQMIFANSKGQWMGKGIGDIYDYQFKFKKEILFPEKGEYKFQIEQAMRERVLTSITDVGIQIEKVEK